MQEREWVIMGWHHSQVCASAPGNALTLSDWPCLWGCSGLPLSVYRCPVSPPPGSPWAQPDSMSLSLTGIRPNASPDLAIHTLLLKKPPFPQASGQMKGHKTKVLRSLLPLIQGSLTLEFPLELWFHRPDVSAHSLSPLRGEGTSPHTSVCWGQPWDPIIPDVGGSCVVGKDRLLA